MNYDIFMCNGCKKNLFKKDRCNCVKYSDDEQTLIFNMFFVSPSIKVKAIEFCIDKVIDGLSEKEIFNELKNKEFKVKKQPQIQEEITFKRNILGQFIVQERTK